MDNKTYIEHAVAPNEAKGPDCDDGPEEEKDTHGQDASIRSPTSKETDKNNKCAKCENIGNCLDQDGTAVSEDKSGANVGGAWPVGSKEEIERVLSRTIEEVVAEVTRDADAGILEGTDLGSVAGSGHVRLHGAGAGVGGGDDIGIVSPDVAEHVLKGSVLVTERGASGHEANILKDAVKGVAGEHALHHIGSVETVHAVGAHDAGLVLASVKVTVDAGWRVDGPEVALLVEGIGQLLDEGICLVHLHALGLAVVVKVDVVQPVKLLAATLGLYGGELLLGEEVGLM